MLEKLTFNLPDDVVAALQQVANEKGIAIETVATSFLLSAVTHTASGLARLTM